MKDKEFRFDPIEHRYWIGDEEMPSVTKIISPLNDFSMVNEEVLENAKNRGINIHETIRLYLNGTLDESTLAEGNKIALELFEKWFVSEEACRFGVLKECENPTYHKKLKYGGTADLVFDEAIVDIKTSFYKSMELKCAIQLAAYEKLYSDFPPKKLYVLHLDIVKRVSRLINVERKQSWSMFRFLYDYYKAGEKIKSWKML